MKILSLILAAPLALCQHATIDNFQSPNIKGIKIGTHDCVIWMHDKAYQPYNFEVICTGDALPDMVFSYLVYNNTTPAVVHEFKFVDGVITWSVTPLANGKFRLEFVGLGTDDAATSPTTPVTIKGDF